MKWALKWRSENELDGKREYLILYRVGDVLNAGPLVFKTRKDARYYRDKYYGYIRERPDLRKEPHGWKMPAVVKVEVTVREIEG